MSVVMTMFFVTLMSREANQILEGLDHLSFVQVGMKLSCSASVGESLKLLRFYQGAIEVKDERPDHVVILCRLQPSLIGRVGSSDALGPLHQRLQEAAQPVAGFFIYEVAH